MLTLTTLFAQKPNKLKKNFYLWKKPINSKHNVNALVITFFTNNFLKANESTKLVAKVSGKRKREVGLVVPVKLKAFTKENRLGKLLNFILAKKNTHTLRSYIHEENSL